MSDEDSKSGGLEPALFVVGGSRPDLGSPTSSSVVATAGELGYLSRHATKSWMKSYSQT